jgi:hypothetical protein
VVGKMDLLVKPAVMSLKVSWMPWIDCSSRSQLFLVKGLQASEGLHAMPAHDCRLQTDFDQLKKDIPVS